MSLSMDDIHRIAKLGMIELTEAQTEKVRAELNDIFAMIERISAVDTDHIEPMPNPHDGVQRLRDDKVTETDNRVENMKNAPSQEEGCFLVPQVIE